MKVIAVISTLFILSITLCIGCTSDDSPQNSHYYSKQYSNSRHLKNSDLGVVELMYLAKSDTKSIQASTPAGAIADGKSSAKNMTSTTSDLYEIQVRMNDGKSETILQERVPDLRVGNRVRIVDGRVYLY